MALAVQDIAFFQGLSESEISAVRSCLFEKNFQKGEMLFMEDNKCERVFFVKSGRVRLYRIASSGREQTLETLGPGETCACNPGSREWFCASTAEAVTPCTVWFLSRDRYVNLVQSNAKLSHALNRLFAERLRCFSSLIEEVSLKDSRKRLVKFLLDMLETADDRNSKTAALSVPFTREELAQRLGVVRETVARQLYQLKRLRFIEIKPHQVIIRDKDGLKRLLRDR